LCLAYERFKDPAGVHIEASKWDGHFEDVPFLLVRKLEEHALRSGQNGWQAANVLRSTAGVDAYGLSWICSGDLIQWKRCNRKSGTWETSIGNKNGNMLVALTLAKEASGFDTMEEVLEKIDFMVEGDDLHIVTERDLAAKILQRRDQVYKECGFPQRGDPYLCLRPEDADFCSHGATRLSTGICVPIRSLQTVMGRLCIPITNNTFTLNTQMAARSLTSCISFAATYWFLPEVRKYWSAVREMIPKSVIAASVSPTEKWRFVYNLGGVDPISFNLNKFIEDRFGPNALDSQLSSVASNALNLPTISGIQNVEAGSAVKQLLQNGPNPFKNSKCILWYSRLISARDIRTDVEKMKSSGLHFGVIAETGKQIRDLVRNGSTDFSTAWRSMRATIGSARQDLMLIFSEREEYRAQLVEIDYENKSPRADGFRGQTMTTYILGKNQHGVIKTGVYDFVAIAFTFLALFCASIISPIFRAGKTATVRPGLKVEATGKVLVTDKSAYRFVDIKGEPEIRSEGWLARALTLPLSVESSVNLDKSSAIDTLSYLLENHRRFGMIKFDNESKMHSALFYRRNWQDKLMEKFDRDEVAKIVDIPVSSLEANKFWTYNGGMVTPTKHKGTLEFGQYERPLRLFKTLEGSVRNCCFFLRIDDCPMARADNKHPNQYLFPEAQISLASGNGLIFGESGAKDYIDIPKPFDADILAGSSSNMVDWLDKEDIALFRGGLTGMGCTAFDNSRLELMTKQEDHNLVFPCDYGLTSALDRISVSLNGVLSKKKRESKAKTLSYVDQSAYRILIVLEGNECADRVGHYLETGSLVIYVKPNRCIGDKAWWSSVLVDKYNVMLASDVDDIVRCLEFYKSNTEECKQVAARGRILGLQLLSPTFQKSYVLNMLEELSNTGDVTEVEAAVSWHLEHKTDGTILFRDSDFGYSHGLLIPLKSRNMTYNALDVDIGCGISISNYVGAKAIEFDRLSVALIPGVEKLLESEVTHANSLLAIANLSIDASNELKSNLGTLGFGNHFAEIMSNGIETFLVCHTGSREFIKIWIDENITNREGPVGKKVIPILKAAEEFAVLNREICARLLGATGKPITNVVHDRILDRTELTDGPTLCMGLTTPGEEVWILGSAGTGMAKLVSQADLVPHGMGGKGSRVRNFKQVKKTKWYKTVARLRASDPWDNFKMSVDGKSWHSLDKRKSGPLSEI